MTDDPRIEALLQRWREARERGENPPIDELCREAPTLVGVVRQRIEALADQAGVPPTRNPLVETLADLAADTAPAVESRLGSFVLKEVLGEGGMGRVYRGVDEKLKREVAIKVMLPHLALQPEARRRFLREARAMAKLKHDHIVAIHHVDDSEIAPFFVMELLRGESLHQRQVREGVLPLADVIRIGRETAEGLAHAHDQGMIHRDIKPLNLWLEAGTGRVKILDFGLVRMDQHSGTMTVEGLVMGTLGFIAPEQMDSRAVAVDHRCDQFSLGCVLYLLCTGRPAFKPFGPPPRPPQDHNPAVPAALNGT